MGISISLIQMRGPSKKYVFDSTLYRAFEHLGLAYVASSLINAGHSVEIIDGLLENLSTDQIKKRINRSSPNLIGFTATVVDIEEVGEFSNELKLIHPTCHITIGGHLATCAPEELLNTFKALDSVVIGEGEATAIELSKRLFQDEDLHGIDGLLFRYGDKIVRGKPRIPLDIDDIPFPHRYALDYRKANNLTSIARFITSRGCSFNCKYCTTPKFISSQNSPKWRGRSIENVMIELRNLVAQYSPKVVIFCDDNVVEPTPQGIKRLRSFAESMIEEKFGFKFWIMCRPEVIAHNEDILDLLVKAGMWGTFLGIESANTDQLKYFGRSADLKTYEKAIHLLHNHNVVPELGFMMFYPRSNKDQLMDNADFLLRVGEADQWRYFANAVSIFPGTHLKRNRLSEGWIPPEWVVESEEEHLISELCWMLKRAVQINRSNHGFESILASQGERLLESIGSINYKNFNAILDTDVNLEIALNTQREMRLFQIQEILSENQDVISQLEEQVRDWFPRYNK